MTTQFVILGQPRTGTTYLLNVLNQCTDVLCEGEIFSPVGIMKRNGKNNDNLEDYIARDKDPLLFLDSLMKQQIEQRGNMSAWGCKMMLAHKPIILNELLSNPDIKIIYVTRENKLAQYSSLMKAMATNEWTQGKNTSSKHADAKMEFSLHSYNYYSGSFIAQEELLNMAARNLPENKFMSIEYLDLFDDQKLTDIVKFLGAQQTKPFESSLEKQGQNFILERFSNTGLVKRYFSGIGKALWLGLEI